MWDEGVGGSVRVRHQKDKHKGTKKEEDEDDDDEQRLKTRHIDKRENTNERGLFDQYNQRLGPNQKRLFRLVTVMYLVLGTGTASGRSAIILAPD